MGTKWDAVVIGGGIGGLATGALLAHAGQKVLVLEKNGLLGGRCTTYERDGFHIDVGVHLFGVGEKGTLGEVLRRVGRPEAVTWLPVRDPKPLLYYDGRLQPYSRQAMLSMLPTDAVQGMADLFQAMFTLEDAEIEELWHVPLYAWMTRYTSHPLSHLFLEGICGQYFCVPSAEASTAEFVRCFREVVTARSSAYPKGGCVAIPQAYASVITDLGGQVRLNAPVAGIRVEEGRATGVRTKDGTFHAAGRIVSNADIKTTVLDLAGPEHFPGPYVEKVRNLRYAMHVLGLKVALDRRVTDQKFVMYMPWSFEKLEAVQKRFLEGEIPERTGGMITSPSNFDPALAPEGKQLLFFGTACLPNQDWELWGRRCREAFLEVFPEARDHVLWDRLDTPDFIDRMVGEEGNVIGVAQTVDQVAGKRPSVQTPLPGLYLAGAEAGGHGIGAELAASSALEVADLIVREEGAQRADGPARD